MLYDYNWILLIIDFVHETIKELYKLVSCKLFGYIIRSMLLGFWVPIV